MLAIQVAIGVDHLRLDPQPEVHTEAVHVVDEAFQALREFLRIYDPVAQAGVVVVARAEPSVVHHEQLDPQLSGLVRQFRLPGFVDVEGGRLP
jgi:hypothetical protein